MSNLQSSECHCRWSYEAQSVLVCWFLHWEANLDRWVEVTMMLKKHTFRFHFPFALQYTPFFFNLLLPLGELECQCYIQIQIINWITIMILSFQTDRPGQTVQTLIRLLLEEHSDLIRVYTVCNALCIFWMHYSKVKPPCSTFRVITANFRVSEFLGFLWYTSQSQSWSITFFVLDVVGILKSDSKPFDRNTHYFTLDTIFTTQNGDHSKDSAEAVWREHSHTLFSLVKELFLAVVRLQQSHTLVFFKFSQRELF